MHVSDQNAKYEIQRVEDNRKCVWIYFEAPAVLSNCICVGMREQSLCSAEFVTVLDLKSLTTIFWCGPAKCGDKIV